jgi:DNA-binding CsgD family transcriptional regulator
VNYQIALIEGRGEAMLVEQERKRKETIFFFLWMLTAMLFIGLFVFFYFHRKTAKARLHLAELQKQQLDEEVTRERLEKELAELKAMQNAQKLNKAQRENVAISLQLATSDGKTERNKQLQLLEEQIKSLDPHFYDKLETKYPNLTRGELRLIAFMKLRMSNQDVMEVMNITQSALQKSRYRLRKKLGVPERENLENFIAKL